MDVKALLKRIEKMDADAKAKAISNFVSESKRKTTVEEYRREVRAKVFDGCRKLTKAQQETYIYEYLAANPTWMSNWMRKKHEDLYATKADKAGG